VNLFNDVKYPLQEVVNFYKYFKGTEAEKHQLKSGVENTEQFLTDLKDITTAQSKEVDATQRNTLELFAWVEEARTRQKKLKDPKQVITFTFQLFVEADTLTSHLLYSGIDKS
jgi:hypothetical protein